MSVTSRTTTPWTPCRDTSATGWPAGTCELHTTATGGGPAGPPAVGLGNGGWEGRATGVVATGDGDFFGGVVPGPHATASTITTSRSRFMPPAILRPTRAFYPPDSSRNTTTPNSAHAGITIPRNRDQ